jgi:K+-transporting ATPase ATPase B chain
LPCSSGESPATQRGDVFLAETGDVIACDGEVIEGIASVDESAITGESAPVIRESGGDRSAVTGGTRVLSDWLVIRVTADPGGGFLDRMIHLIEGARRQKTPNEIALNILLAAFTIIFLVVCATLLPYSVYSVAASGRGTPVTITVLIALLVCLIPTTIGGLLSAIGIAGMDRMIRHNVIASSGRALQAFKRREFAAASPAALWCRGVGIAVRRNQVDRHDTRRNWHGLIGNKSQLSATLRTGGCRVTC